jgi:hypothetical protein
MNRFESTILLAIASRSSGGRSEVSASGRGLPQAYDVALSVLEIGE